MGTTRILAWPPCTRPRLLDQALVLDTGIWSLDTGIWALDTEIWNPEIWTSEIWESRISALRCHFSNARSQIRVQGLLGEIVPRSIQSMVLAIAMTYCILLSQF